MFTENTFPSVALNKAVSFGLLGTPFDQFPGSSRTRRGVGPGRGRGRGGGSVEVEKPDQQLCSRAGQTNHPFHESLLGDFAASVAILRANGNCENHEIYSPFGITFK
jgi:hypothetical protein